LLPNEIGGSLQSLEGFFLIIIAAADQHKNFCVAKVIGNLDRRDRDVQQSRIVKFKSNYLGDLFAQ
jgi:hypothetical protein